MNKPNNKQIVRKRKNHDASLALRAFVRTGGVAILFSTIFYGAVAGGHLEGQQNPVRVLNGKIAAYFGYAAGEIAVSGLKRHKPRDLLHALGIGLHDSLIGFNSRQAKKALENVDWVLRVEVRRIYPNQLEIDVVERKPVAIWQRDGEFYVVDKHGSAFTSLEAKDIKGKIVVTGEGAHKHVFELVNHIEAHDGLKSRIAAAGWIGDRRWNLYLKSGMVVMLPEKDLATGLEKFLKLDTRFDLSQKAVSRVDLRLGDRVVITRLKQKDKNIKVSLNQ
jgi:cell division protein FtsQ